MSLATVVVILMGAVGMANIVVYSDLFQPFKDAIQPRLPPRIAAALDCVQCMGTWSGFLCYFLALSPYTAWFVFGCAASFAAVLALNVVTYLETNAVIDLGQEIPEDDDAE